MDARHRQASHQHQSQENSRVFPRYEFAHYDKTNKLTANLQGHKTTQDFPYEASDDEQQRCACLTFRLQAARYNLIVDTDNYRAAVWFFLTRAML